MYWLLYPIICSVLWGVSYTLLKPVSAELQKYTINSIYGLSMFIINMVALAITNQYSDFLLINNLKVILCLTFYVILSVAAGILFLVGYNLSLIHISEPTRQP
jgi:drug/metabolite transporter (DMT)-like permease